jgi:hypothetical protein
MREFISKGMDMDGSGVNKPIGGSNLELARKFDNTLPACTPLLCPKR